MKKVLSGVVAGALLLSSAAVVFAFTLPTTTVQNVGTVTSVTTSSSSYTGSNSQTNLVGGSQFMITGNAKSSSSALVVANGNAAGSSFGGTTVQNVSTNTGVNTVSSSYSGSNSQHGGFGGSQFVKTGNAGSKASNVVVANVNFSF